MVAGWAILAGAGRARVPAHARRELGGAFPDPAMQTPPTERDAVVPQRPLLAPAQEHHLATAAHRVLFKDRTSPRRAPRHHGARRAALQHQAVGRVRGQGQGAGRSRQVPGRTCLHPVQTCITSHGCHARQVLSFDHDTPVGTALEALSALKVLSAPVRGKPPGGSGRAVASLVASPHCCMLAAA